MLRPVLFICLVAFGLQSFAQGDAYYINALRFSQSQIQGSARTLGFAGAQTALGADLGSLSANPAGLGFYRKSEFSLGTNFSIVNTKSSTPGFANTPDSKLNFNVNTLGVAFCGIRDDLVETKWRGGTFAIGLSRTASFQNTTTYRGETSNSLADYIVNRANNEGFNWNNYDKNNANGLVDLGYGAFLFSPYIIGYSDDNKPVYSNSEYYSLQPPQEVYGNTTYRKEESINERGGINEWTAAYGGNYNNKFYFGASVALSRLRYDRENRYSEYALNNIDTISNVTTDITLDETLKVRGTGLNVGLGVAYVFSDIVRVGASFKSPTYMWLNETYNATLSANYANVTLEGQPNSASKSANPQENKYTLTSPLKLNGGIAFFLGKAGFITTDIEFLDYSSSIIGGSSKTLYISTNQTIKSVYQSAINYKVGAELRYEMFRFRGGYALLSSPWKSDVTETNRRIRSDAANVFTLGLGVRTNEFFLDAAFSRTFYNNNYSPYVMSGSPDNLYVKTTNAMNNVTIGFGMFF